ncbi:MAG TPA: HEAT repeat domain-containing protein [Methanospirillum sp.]|nr:HEAT repeat domain-containing protein [Methanospirillum sp.]
MISLFRPDPERMRLKGDLLGLIKLVQSSQDSVLRSEAVLALGRMQTPRAVNILIGLFDDPDDDVVAAAAEALELTGKPAILPLILNNNTADEYAARCIHLTLLNIGEGILPDLIASIPQLNDAGVERAAYTLDAFGRPGLSALIDALGSSDPTISRFAEAAIETFGDEAISALIQALDNQHENVRARAAALLILLGDRIVPDLLASCSQDRDETRTLKFFIISEIGEPALDPLYSSLKDPNPVTSSMALNVFLEIGDAAIGPLINGLFEKNSNLRSISENALIRIGEPIVPHLISEIPLHSQTDREIITTVLIRIGEPALADLTAALFDPSADISRTMNAILPRMGALSAPYLLQAVEERGDGAGDVVKKVFREIGRLAFPVLQEVIPLGNEKTAIFAIRMLRDIDPVRAIDPLIDTLSGNNGKIRETALDELLMLGDIAIPRLIQTLSSSNEDAASLANTALQRLGEDAAPHLADALSDTLIADKEQIRIILQGLGNKATPYLIPLTIPGTNGREIAARLIEDQGSEAVPILLDASDEAGPALSKQIRDLLSQAYVRDPQRFIAYAIDRETAVNPDLLIEITSSSPEQIIPHLLKIIRDGTSEQGQRAGDLLIRYGTASLGPLIKSLKEDQDEEHKLVITSFLVRMGASAVPDLIEALSDPDTVLYAVAALGAIKEPAIGGLIHLLQGPDDTGANYAGLTLARIGDPALPALFELFKKNEAMIPLVSRIFVEMGGQALPRLLDEFSTLEKAGEQGSSRGIALMSMILEISLTNTEQMKQLFSIRNDELTRMLSGILISKGEVVLDPMIGALLSWDREIPDLVIQTFSNMRVRVLTRIHEVFEHLPDQDNRRIPLIRVLGELHDPSSAPILFNALNDSDKGIRVTAARVLGRFGPEALKPLTKAMQDDSLQVRVAATEAMGEVGLAALDQLLKALKDDNGDIRAAAIAGIGKVGEPAKFMLIESLNDEDRNVRKEVVQLLDSFSWEPKYTTDRLSYLYAKEDYSALIKIGPPSVDILARGLHDPDPEVREACRDALTKIRSALPI